MYFTLDKDRNIVPADLKEWAKIFSDNKSRTVEFTEINGYLVSTVFLGLDHSGPVKGVPLVFETYITGYSIGASLGVYARYATWEQAQEGHRNALISLIEIPEW